jgi:thioredoxin reductase (NADPH)
MTARPDSGVRGVLLTSVADEAAAFPTLDPPQLALLGTIGDRRSTRVGEYLYRSGDQTNDFFVILSGGVDTLVDTDGPGEPFITQHGSGRFLGELNLLGGQRVYVSARVAEAGEVLRVPADALRRAIATNARLGDTILTAFMARRQALLAGATSSIRLVGSRYCARTHAVREFLARSRIPHEWLDPEIDDSGGRLAGQLDLVTADFPVVVMAGAVLRQVTPGAVAEYLGLTLDRFPGRCVDLVVVGGGPAGLAAAVYGASEGLRTLALDTLAPGGQAGTSPRIENYLGFPTGISGGDWRSGRSCRRRSSVRKSAARAGRPRCGKKPATSSSVWPTAPTSPVEP